MLKPAAAANFLLAAVHVIAGNLLFAGLHAVACYACCHLVENGS